MIKNIYLITIFNLFRLVCHAQVNLVQNGSFEEFTVCPTMAGQIQLVKHWWSAGGTPEYFNACSNGSVNVPNTLMGFQHGKNSVAFAGITLWYPWYLYREYIQTKLSNPLIKDKIYCVTFYVNLADMSAVAIDKIGACFSNDTIKAQFPNGLIDTIPSISNLSGNIIKDTVNWVKISGEYIAKGNEQILTIGNFYNDENTKVDTVNSIPGGYAYYFIDDVSVYKCDDTITDNLITLPNAFTPNSDGVNDYFKAHEQNIKTITGKIISRWGQELYKWNDLNSGWDGKYKGKDVSEGTYFYIIIVIFEDGKMEEKRGSVELIR